MTDVVIRLPILSDKEAILFSAYLDRFMRLSSADADDRPEGADAPFLIVHTAPALDRDVKMLTFQTPGAARAFSVGWARAKGQMDGYVI